MQEVETLFHEAGHCLQHMLTGEQLPLEKGFLFTVPARLDAAEALYSSGRRLSSHELDRHVEECSAFYMMPTCSLVAATQAVLLMCGALCCRAG